MTTAEAGGRGSSDDAQLRFATNDRRVLVTFNRGHFARLHGEFLAAAVGHSGIIVSAQAGIGAVVRGLARVLGSADADGLKNRLIWLDVKRPER